MHATTSSHASTDAPSTSGPRPGLRRAALRGLLVAAGAAMLMTVAELVAQALVINHLVPNHRAWDLSPALGLERVAHIYPWHLRDSCAAVLAILLVSLPAMWWGALPAGRRHVLAAISGIAAGGVIANTAERVSNGSVTDFIRVRLGEQNYVANFADVALIAGVAAVALVAFHLTARALANARAASNSWARSRGPAFG